MSFPGWSTDRHIRPNIRISSQQHFNKWIWSARLSSTKPADSTERRERLLPAVKLDVKLARPRVDVLSVN